MLVRVCGLVKRNGPIHATGYHSPAGWPDHFNGKKGVERSRILEGGWSSL